MGISHRKLVLGSSKGLRESSPQRCLSIKLDDLDQDLGSNIQLEPPKGKCFSQAREGRPRVEGSKDVSRATTSMEDVSLNRFHWKVAIYSAGGMFCDGYILTIIATALPLLAPDLGLSPIEITLVGATALEAPSIGE